MRPDTTRHEQSDSQTIIGGAVRWLRRPRRSRTTALAEACGGVASRFGRRGSALILVLGALALISIFAAVYVTVGQSDRRTSTALAINRSVSEFPLIFADHITAVIGDDRTATMAQTEIGVEGEGGPVGGSLGGSGGGPGGTNQGMAKAKQSLVRENIDLPYTDFSVRSLPFLSPSFGPPQELLKFNAVGTHYDAQTNLGIWSPPGSDVGTQLQNLARDTRAPSDPWLASTEPTYLGSPILANRLYSESFANGDAVLQSQLFYQDDRDWAHITNISPDGLFVNLWNLRPEAGGYGAKPGFTQGGLPTAGSERMSDNLSLIRSTGNVQQPLRAMDVRTEGFWVPGYDQPEPWNVATFGQPENVPALWSSNQRFMLLPMNQQFIFNDRNNVLADWSSRDYPAYQYADTDGDGLADARWFELTDSSDTRNLGNLIFRNLAAVDGYRLFAAARIVDLSALVNVNTATDGLLPPTSLAWAGSTPADIDLRRILSMADSSRDSRDWVINGRRNLGPTAYKRDGRPTRLGRDPGDPYADYSNYWTIINQGDPTLYDDMTALLIGRYGSDALTLAILGEGTLGETASGGGRDTSLTDTSTWYGDPDAWPGTSTAQDTQAALRRLFYYDRIGSLDPTDPMSAGVAGLGAGYFGAGDLAELLTFWGINDDQVFSRLEQTVGNRYDNSATGIVAESSLRHSPLLSGRPTELDRGRHDTLNRDRDRLRGSQPTGQVDPESMALLASSVRRQITTFSKHSPLLASRLATADVASLSSGEVPELTHEFLDGLSGGGTGTGEVLGLYIDALADAARADNTWAAAGGQITLNEYSTLFYGAAGPEFAVRLSAHLSANLIDIYDDDDEPTPISLLVTQDETLAAEFDSLSMGGGAGNPSATAFPWDPSSIIDLDDLQGQQYAGADNQATTEAYTVYGVEAYPVLTEVSALVVMTDASMDAGGDNESSGGRPWVPIGGPEPSEITIAVDDWDGDADGGTFGPDGAWYDSASNTGNPDLAFVGFSFQLTNPFDQSINLGSESKGDGVPLDDDEYLYYLEFNGRYFKVGDWDETDYNNVVLGPGESKTFYVLANPTLQQIADRWTDLVDAYTSGAMVDVDDVQDWLDSQYGVDQGGGDVVEPGRALKFNPRSGRVVLQNAYENILLAGGASQTLFNRPATNRTIRLWRRMEVPGATTANNTPEHDLLVDRLQQPAGPGGQANVNQTLLPVPRSLDEDEVKDTIAGPESLGGNIAGPSDNSGWTYAFYGSIRRGDHPGTATGRNGVLPAWMIDLNGANAIAETVPFQNSLLPSGGEQNPGRLKDTHFGDFSRRYAHDSFADFLELADPDKPIVATIGHHPYIKSTIADSDVSGLFATKTISPLDGDTFYEPAMAPGTIALYPELGPGERDAIEKNQNVPFGAGTNFMADVPLVRATDLLLVPAIGWFEAPDVANPANFDDDQWVTFGEALAYAMHLVPANTGDPVLRHLVRDIGGTERRYALDGINIRVDDFVPFYNANLDQDRLFEPDQGDTRVGSGVPMAIDLLSKFRGMGPESKSEALTAGVPGMLNLNTVARGVLPAAPLLTPSLEFNTAGDPEWWGSNPAMGSFGSGLPDAVADAALSRAPDVAAHLISYRDRLAGEYRRWSYDYAAIPGGIGGAPFGYRMLDQTGLAARPPAEAAQIMLRNYGYVGASPMAGDVEQSRSLLTGIGGLRERPGFTSSGEAAAAVISTSYFEDVLGDTSLMEYDLVKQNQPTYLGIDEDTGNTPLNTGVNTGGAEGLVTLETQLYDSGSAGDDIPNDYEERLAVLSGLLNTTTTRSDTFAVWFVVHGYRESDVKNLRPDDPLTPSYARRFLMVVDRSNVTTLGQKPRVVLFQEVPN